ncbi:hypothetical protein COOONC_19042 [Cooperia oncophora]
MCFLLKYNLLFQSYLGTEMQFSELIMKLWTDFANTGSPAPYWPKYNRIERKALVLGEESIRGEHRVITDVHGTHCRLIEEAETVSGQVSECRARRTQPAAIQSAENGGNRLTATVIAVIVVLVKALN